MRLKDLVNRIGITKWSTKRENLTAIVNYNILMSYIFNGLSLLISFISVPLFIELFSDSQYGVWLTLLSIITWLTILDFGIGQGLRNKFPEALHKGQTELAKSYIEIIYFLATSLAIVFFGVSLIIEEFFDFNIVFNAGDVPEDLNSLVILVIFLFTLQFVGNIINGLLHSLQKSRFLVVIDFFSKLMMLLGLIYLISVGLSSLYIIAIITMGSRVLITVACTIYIYNFLKINHNIRFSVISFSNLKYKFSLLKQDQLISVSIKFFVISISSIFLINSVNYLITYLYSPSAVVPFNISFKLYSSLLFLFYLFVAPFWSAITESYVKKDYTWIIKNLYKMMYGYVVYIVLLIIIFLASSFIYNIWVPEVEISTSINFAVFIYVIIIGWNALYAHFLNGINKLNTQLIIAVIHILTNIPLCILLAKVFNFGVIGLVWGTNISLLLLSIGLPIQVASNIKQLKPE